MDMGGSDLNRLLTLALLCALFCAVPSSLNAQTPAKKRTPVRKKTPAETTKPATVNYVAEAEQVGVQIKNVSKFLFVYGKIVNSLQVADDLNTRGEVAPAIQAKNKQSKDALISTIGGLRTGIETLARGFKENPKLQVFSLKLGYASDAVVNAEQLATAGRYDDAGKALTLVIERLTDTMAAMR